MFFQIQTCPVPWCQLFVIQAVMSRTTSYPVVFGLLPNKTSATYLKFFQEVAALDEDIFKGKLYFKKKKYIYIYFIYRILIFFDYFDKLFQCLASQQWYRRILNGVFGPQSRQFFRMQR